MPGESRYVLSIFFSRDLKGTPSATALGMAAQTKKISIARLIQFLRAALNTGSVCCSIDEILLEVCRFVAGMLSGWGRLLLPDC